VTRLRRIVFLVYAIVAIAMMIEMTTAIGRRLFDAIASVTGE
jgi:hypothetical protein